VALPAAADRVVRRAHAEPAGVLSEPAAPADRLRAGRRVASLGGGRRGSPRRALLRRDRRAARRAGAAALVADADRAARVPRRVGRPGGRSLGSRSLRPAAGRPPRLRRRVPRARRRADAAAGSAAARSRAGRRGVLERAVADGGRTRPRAPPLPQCSSSRVVTSPPSRRSATCSSPHSERSASSYREQVTPRSSRPGSTRRCERTSNRLGHADRPDLERLRGAGVPHRRVEA